MVSSGAYGLQGTKPPEIEPLIIDVDKVNPDELVISRAK
jgi:hypothetical protein